MKMNRSKTPGGGVVKQYVWTVVQAVSVSIGLMLAFLGLLVLVPEVAPVLWLMVPVGVIAGFAVLWRRYPRDAYLIGLLYVPMMSVLLIWMAAQISWTVVGDYL